MIDKVLISVLSALRLFGRPPCVDVCQHTFRQEGKDRDHCVALESGMLVTMAKDVVACNALIDLFDRSVPTNLLAGPVYYPRSAVEHIGLDS